MSYFNQHALLLLLFILSTIIILGIVCYTIIIRNTKQLKDTWATVRCYPQNIIFAGFINTPPNSTMFNYTIDNFKYCTQNI